VILAICILLWWLSAYPKVAESSEVTALRAQAESLRATDPDRAEELAAAVDHQQSRAQLAGSFAGKIGRTIEPIYRPLGYDWQLTIGVLTSFAAREVFVSTLSVLFTGEDKADSDAVLSRIKSAQRSNGTPVFTTATSASLLVFYVLAMQCLATLVVTRRETGSWKWSVLQFGYMTAVAYAAAFITYNGLRMAGVT
jgi:ferrous iron transport protein B